MKSLQLLIQLAGITALALGVLDGSLVTTIGGFAVIVLSLADEINKNTKNIEKLNMQIRYDARLAYVEKKLDEIAKLNKAGRVKK